MEYRLPKLRDKNDILLYIQEHYAVGEMNLNATNTLVSMPFEDWVNKIHSNATESDTIWGKSLTYLVFDDLDKLIGFLNIRYDLSDELVNKYGHIGYGVRPSERRKGYATKILQIALTECKKLGMNCVILGCHKENIASVKTIIKNGGKLIRETNNFVALNDYYKINLINQFYKINLKNKTD